ncbi:histidine phosphatase family protein [Psychrobacter sp. FDAARGOS_221]|uniref:histidine phosphatase family protein n=1 Tax=Psychrobacter sp. FDAARGOS_221 TaxID=1975705 RepID=UPI000BB59D9D|nr:histidine phosphatase family protein [Psychrobacter sp. FDAARGOS_221]PNK61317.1 histidine phosphatase family protein [Psychrobacter sp. FDAARGOS_221]
MRKIYLVRHGQSTANAGGDAQPNAQIELTELGHQQAQEVAQWLSDTLGDNVASINVSSFVRTQQTAQPYLDQMQRQAQVIDGLEEFTCQSFAKINGLPFQTRLAMVDEYWASAQPDEAHGADAESFLNFYQRVQQVLVYFQTLPKGNHVVYTHGYWISMVIWQLLGLSADTQQEVAKFRQFEKSIRAKNGEVFCLTLPESGFADSYPPSITKARYCLDQFSDLSA